MCRKGFTLVEVIIVLVVIGMITAFAVPNWQKSVEKADEKEAVSNLAMIYEAARIFETRGGAFVVDDLNNIEEINSTLGIHIIESNVVYSCHYGIRNVIYCRGQSPSGWIIRMNITKELAGHIYCSAGNCPSGAGTHYN